MVRHLRLTTRVGAALLAGREIHGLLHGRRSPTDLVSPSCRPSKVQSDALRRRGGRRDGKEADQNKVAGRQDEATTSSKENAPCFGKHKPKGSRGWNILYDRLTDALANEGCALDRLRQVEDQEDAAIEQILGDFEQLDLQIEEKLLETEGFGAGNLLCCQQQLDEDIADFNTEANNVQRRLNVLKDAW